MQTSTAPIGQPLLNAAISSQGRSLLPEETAAAERDLASRISLLRGAAVAAIVLILATAMWGVGELEERGVTTEPEDAVITVGVIVMVALLSRWFDHRFVKPMLRSQDAALRQTIREHRLVKQALERELAARQTFIEQANHQLRTPVTVIYGALELLFEHDETLTPEVRHELRASVLNHASTLKHMVEHLSTFLDDQLRPGAAPRSERPVADQSGIPRFVVVDPTAN